MRYTVHNLFTAQCVQTGTLWITPPEEAGMTNDSTERQTRSELPRAGGLVRPQYETLAEWMREEPAEWFLIARSGSYSTTANMKRGAYGAFPVGEFQFRSLKNKTGQIETWGRVKS